MNVWVAGWIDGWVDEQMGEGRINFFIPSPKAPGRLRRGSLLLPRVRTNVPTAALHPHM